MLVQGSGTALLDRAMIPQTLPNGRPDPGIATRPEAFLKALAQHRHFDREADPPLV